MKSGLDLIITARDADGNQISQECREGDLYLWNFASMLAHFFWRQFNTADITAYSQTSLNGTAITADSSFGSSHSLYSQNNAYWRSTLRALVSTGTTSPTITDYALGGLTSISAMTTCPKIITTTGSNILKLMMSATFPMVSETICGDCGLVMKSPATINNTQTDATKILLTRDIFTPVTVPAGGSLTIQFELWFNGTPPVI